jgi:hypothetical protein
MNNLSATVSRFGMSIAILLSNVSLVLFGQTDPTSAPFQIATPSAARTSTMDFAVAVEAGWLHPKSMDENFWLIRGDRNGSTIASPIHGLLYIRFTNLADMPMMIDSYSIEVLDGRGTWVSLVTIDAHSGEVYNRGPSSDMKQARRFNIEQDTFDYSIANKNIGPHDTVRGWVLVEAVEADLDNIKDARLSVADSLGNKDARVMKILAEESGSLQPRLLHVGETKDLSQARKQFYSESNPSKP